LTQQTPASKPSAGRVALLTGGAGYVGSVLAPMLVSSGFSVRIIDRLFFGNPFLNESEITVIKKDIRDINESDLVGVSDVIDLAAISNDPSGDLDKALTIDINFKARRKLQELCLSQGVGRYILASSSSVYGFQDEIVDEESKINPLTIYAEANSLAEQAAIANANAGTIFSVIRQGTVYGASRRMRYDLVVNAMALNVIQGNPIKVLRDGQQWRPLVHVRDTSRAIIELLSAPPALVDGEIFNVGSDKQNHTIIELAQIVSQALGKESKVEWYGDLEHRSYRVSFEKIRNTLGFEPEMTVSLGALEIESGFNDGSLAPKPENYTLAWYQKLLAEGLLR
jgi:nucleoside-diphosphate-sugar epimerase